MNRRNFLTGILGATGAAAMPDVKIPEAKPCARCSGHKFICERVPSEPFFKTYDAERGVMPTLFTPRGRVTQQVPCPECSK